MRLLAGLGNPGNKYDGTRHNIGFDIIDSFLSRHNLEMTDQIFRADYTIYHHNGEKILIMKPFTYMNLSGEAILPMMSYFGIGMDDILIIHDDLDLEVGRLRLRQKGSSGGQRGMQSIIDLLGSNEFKRMKVGIGRPAPGWKVVDHVLAPFRREEQEAITQGIHRATDVLDDWAKGQTFEQLMQKYN